MNKLIVSCVLLLCTYTLGYAAIPIATGGNGLRFDRSRVSQAYRKEFDIFEASCSRCHSLERVAISFKTGTTPLTGRPFDLDTMKSVMVAMMRKSTKLKAKGQEINKEDAGRILAVMKHFLEEAVQ